MQRFLRLSAKTQGMTFISSTWFKQTKNIRLKESGAFEVLSFESNSYFTKEHEMKVPVGLGDTPLMLEPVLKRMRCKCVSKRFGASPGETPGDIPMHLPGSRGMPKKRKLPSSSQAKGTISSAEVSGALDGSQPSGSDSRVHGAIADLQKYAHHTRHTASTRVFLEDAPSNVRELMKANWPESDRNFVPPAWWRDRV